MLLLRWLCRDCPSSLFLMSPQPRKQFGQHWLRSEKALQQIVKAANLTPDDRVLEIGPGQGVLTRQLLEQAGAVVAIEIDRDLCKLLAPKLGERENFLLLQGDFLAIDLDALLMDFSQFQQPNKVVANIPYNITGPILEKLLGTITQPNPRPYDAIVLLVQLEVANRLCAKAGSRNFGALTVRVQALANCELVTLVSAKSFYPPPKVDSAVVRLVPRLIDPAPIDPQWLDRLVRLGFATKRKMLRNNLQSVIDRDRLSQVLTELGVNPQARAEDLSVANWVALSNRLDAETTD